MKTLYLLTFIILTLSQNSYSSNPISELTGDAARKRTAEARARANELREHVRRVRNDISGVRSNIRAEEISIDNQIRQTHQWQNQLSNLTLEQIRRISQSQEQNKGLLRELSAQKELLNQFAPYFITFSEKSTELFYNMQAALQVEDLISKSNLSFKNWIDALYFMQNNTPLQKSRIMHELIEDSLASGRSVKDNAFTILSHSINQLLEDINYPKLLKANQQWVSLEASLDFQMTLSQNLIEQNEKILIEYEDILRTLKED